MDFRQPLKLEVALRALAKANGYTDEEVEQTIKREGKGTAKSGNPMGYDHNYCLNDYNG